MKNEKESLGFDLKEYLVSVIEEELEIFDEFIQWSENDKIEFKRLLDLLKEPYDKTTETTKDKGDRLENLVVFIIKKSFFFDIFKNVHTQTNEIDEVIVLSKAGRQALHRYNICRTIIPIPVDMFLGECKNYNSSLNVTYVGKFYSLMNTTGITFGIIFTQKGLTGNPAEFKDAYGLTKILRIVEQARENDLYILTFTLEDYEKLLEGITFFDLIDAKMKELQLATSYETFLKDNKHEAEDKIKKIIKSYST